MSEQYLPWSPSEQRYGAFIPEGFKVCQGTCEWLNSHHDYLDGNEYRPARLYTPDEIAALERDRERLEWILDRRGTIHVGQYFVGDRSDVDVARTYEAMRRLRRTESAIYRSMKGGE